MYLYCQLVKLIERAKASTEEEVKESPIIMYSTCPEPGSEIPKILFKKRWLSNKHKYPTRSTQSLVQMIQD